MKMKKIFLVGAILILMLFPSNPAFAKTVHSTAYDNVIKKGNTVYCCNNVGIFKLSLKTGKSRRLVWGDRDLDLGRMMKKGKYIYYTLIGDVTLDLYRVNTVNKKKVMIQAGSLAGKYAHVTDYGMYRNKIYCRLEQSEGLDDKVAYRVMKLNGRSKKKTKIKISMKIKSSNTKGYKLFTKYNYRAHKAYAYLKAPRKTYYLGAIDWWD